jgi:hypothetical protein
MIATLDYAKHIQDDAAYRAAGSGYFVVGLANENSYRNRIL